MSVQGRYPLTAIEGERVRFERKLLSGERVSGEGVFTLCWFGIEEAWTIDVDGKNVTLYPCFGDTMTPIT